ncbi:MPA2 family protein involved in capsular polysaccharide export [Advenella kashmirensis WT001]|uniref:MPA2 family protein involved in capsular polysaccharide export n=1 Tax=Advenella kashmirensis (strain DSM 17095 / LMG 22695 / WT001) TaxID=1036672 RepID=I3UGZ3_ADVKW|nr:Wzz/FepE/Etk N-terminal domain-containing protein [Advenella kashmirensis]AFK64281.1 MPA2 family protein involved in capsular polysaccharide export [Advenella kashmirensis WT001]
MSNSSPKNRFLFIGIVLIPFVVAIIYYTVFATNRYVSTAQVAVRQTDNANSAISNAPGLALLLGATNPTSREETLFLREYIVSNDMLNVLKKEVNWMEHYASIYTDPFYWLDKDARQEDALSYFRKVVQVHFDTETGLLNVQVEAFDPDFSEKILGVILKESEHFVNELSHKLTRDQLAFVERELQTARTNYELRRDEMLAFQAKNNLVDAEATIASRSQMIAAMEAELATEKAKLTALQSSLSATAPQVQQQRRRIEAMAQQLAAENKRLISREGSHQLNTVAATFRDLSIRAKIAEEAYKISLASLENTRIEMNKKFRSLAVITSPNMPDRAIYPDRLYNLLAVLIALLALYGIVRFVMATIEDHKD